MAIWPIPKPRWIQFIRSQEAEEIAFSEVHRLGIVKLTDCSLFSTFLHEAKLLKLRRAASTIYRDFGVNPVNLTKPPGDLKASIGAFVERYKHHRYHEGLGNPDTGRRYCGRNRAIIERRRKIKNRQAKNDAWRTNAKPLNINHHKPEPPL